MSYTSYQFRSDLGGERKRALSEVLEWLRSEPSGVATCAKLRDMIINYSAKCPEHAVLGRLIVELCDDFTERYFGEPLPSTVADNAARAFIGFLERAVDVVGREPQSYVAYLNQISSH